MKKMKRIDMNSNQSDCVDEQSRARLRHQTLLQDYLELQKDFVLKKKKLQMEKHKKETLLAEVRFLGRRHRYLLEIQSSKQKLKENLIQRPNTELQNKTHTKESNYYANGATLKSLHALVKSNPVRGDLEKEVKKKKELGVLKTLRVKKKNKNGLINEKKVGKKKISWEDQVL